NVHVRSRARELGDLLVRDRLHAPSALAVDREHDARHAPLAVVRGDFRNGRTRRVVLEVLLGPVLKLRRLRFPRRANRSLHVRVHVEGDDRVGVDTLRAHADKTSVSSSSRKLADPTMEREKGEAPVYATPGSPFSRA